MSTRIRLQRHGRKNYAFYSIVIADANAPRDGRFTEKIGTYNPNTNPATVDLNFERALYWVLVGLLLTTLWVFHLERNHFDVELRELLGTLCHQLDGIRLVVLNADETLVYIHGFHEKSDTHKNLVCMLEHQAMVGSEVRLTFHGIDDDPFRL